jgi:hypothetical protein
MSEAVSLELSRLNTVRNTVATDSVPLYAPSPLFNVSDFIAFLAMGA